MDHKKHNYNLRNLKINNIFSPGHYLKSRILSAYNTPVLALPASDAFTAIEAHKAGAEVIWIGSLELSLRLGIPDSYVIGLSDLVNTVFSIQKSLVGKISIVADVDTGYGGVNATYNCFRALNILGVAMGIIENKKAGIDKTNSIYDDKGNKWQIETKAKMLQKLCAARTACDEIGRTLVGVRINDLTMGISVDSVLKNAFYFEKANPDCIIIHYNKTNISKLLSFARLYVPKGKCLLGAITACYGKTIEKKKLFDAGFNFLIYPNQNLRKQLSITYMDYKKLIKDRFAGGAIDDKIATNKDLVKKSNSLGYFGSKNLK